MPLLKTITLLILASLLATIALLVPVHLRAIDAAVLELAGQQASSEAEISATLNAAELGQVQLLIQAISREPELKAQYEKTIAALIAKAPLLALSGSPDPTFLDFLKLLNTAPQQSSAVIPLLLPRSERTTLAQQLAGSSKANVRALLEIREINGLTRLHPAQHAAGAPYDSGVLCLALLIEGGHFNPAIAQQIANLADQASLGTPIALRAIEDWVIATLSLGRQLNYGALTRLAQLTESNSDWQQMGLMFRAQPQHIPQLYAAFHWSEAPEQVKRYLTDNPSHAIGDLNVALGQGSGATQSLLESNQPIYQPQALAAQIIHWLNPYRPASFTSICLNHPKAGLTLKFMFLFFAGLCFAWSMGAAWRGSITGIRPVSKGNPLVAIRDVLISLVVVVTVWSFFEPAILKSEKPETLTPPRIEFAQSISLESLKSPIKSMQELNQVTLLVLALFFIIQLVIYAFCLIKLREISKQPLLADLKIKLLENEENLFDFGLYVGLGGTVLSLILVAVGIVEASLMAAYASTLFGILFTALLKVLHLRPYRRELILQANAHQQDR